MDGFGIQKAASKFNQWSTFNHVKYDRHTDSHVTHIVRQPPAEMDLLGVLWLLMLLAAHQDIMMLGGERAYSDRPSVVCCRVASHSPEAYTKNKACQHCLKLTQSI